MATFLVTFEINDDERMKKFKEYLKSFGSYCPIHNYSWAIISNKTATQLKEGIEEHINMETDRLFVLKAGSEASWRNSYGDAWDNWLQKNIVQ